MFNTKIASLSLAAAVLAMSAPAFAAVPSFRSVEFGGDPAAGVETMRADLVSALPQGTALADARTVLRNAGAHCAAADGGLRCHYASVDVQNEDAHDVVWTVDVAAHDGTVTAIAVTRD
jgi:hypothetical protein